jgi:hypothetical protein
VTVENCSVIGVRTWALSVTGGGVTGGRTTGGREIDEVVVVSMDSSGL